MVLLVYFTRFLNNPGICGASESNPMNPVSKLSDLRKIPWGWLLVIAVVFAAAYLISFLFGDNARNSCFWAVVVNGAAALGAIVPVVCAVLLKPPVPVHYVFAANAVRLLLAIVGSGIILHFVKIDVLWFVVCVGTLYIAVLVLEACFVTQTLCKSDETGRT